MAALTALNWCPDLSTMSSTSCALAVRVMRLLRCTAARNSASDSLGCFARSLLGDSAPEEAPLLSSSAHFALRWGPAARLGAGTPLPACLRVASAASKLCLLCGFLIRLPLAAGCAALLLGLEAPPRQRWCWSGRPDVLMPCSEGSLLLLGSSPLCLRRKGAEPVRLLLVPAGDVRAEASASGAPDRFSLSGEREAIRLSSLTLL